MNDHRPRPVAQQATRMEPVCPCGQPARDATLCASCGYRLDEALAQVCAHHGLAWDLDVAAARQSRIVRRPGRPDPADEREQRQALRMPGTLRPTPIPFDDRASTATKHLHTVLAHWANTITPQTDPPPAGPTCPHCAHDSCAAIRRPPQPPKRLTALAAWLRPRVGWIRHRPDAPQALEEILDAVWQARRIVDRPAELLYAGPCDRCDEDMYARPGALIVECANCNLVYEVEARREWLLRAAEDVLATATEIARAVTQYGQPVSPSAVRGYAHRGLLLPRSHNDRGHAMYRLGDVLDVLARQAARDSA